MPNPSQRPPFLPGLGGLRALAALAVLAGHAAAWLTPLPQTPALFTPLARLTQCGLSAFFLLSGFVLQYNYGPALAAGRTPLARFITTRLVRLYPVYLLLLALAVAGLLVSEGPGALGSAANIASYLTLTHGWVFSPESPRLFPLAWAISVEVFFYLLFPPVARLLAHLATPRAALGIGLASLAAILGLDALTAANWPQLFPAVLARYPLWANVPGEFAGVFFPWLTYTSPYFRAFEFVLGAAMARLFVLRPVAVPGLDLLAAAGLLALLLVPLPAGNFFLAVLANNALYAPFLAALCLAWAARPRRWTTHPLLAGIGLASLSIYLVQAWTLPLCKAPAGASTLLWAAMALAGMAVTVAAGMALTRLVEAPAARYLLGMRKRGEKECLRRPGG
ncbi:acyltransferase family protein [Desulfovibrio sp. TomC]|uniref:acyltransferase family protein n=1 Tax=Desulfovibrio sp. TomC TaxID=1562888 RepID=UPI00057397F0|nr:acyltransferase family protein [Desulfovibrio sp. TomC]KHK01952.1 Acyltransferase [Desulfovibrio sp. TomC]